MRVHNFPKSLGNNGSEENHDEIVQNGHSMKQAIQLGIVDLKEGVVPITKAATSLAALLKRARANHEHIVLTQKGRTAGVLLDIDEYLRMRRLAEQQLEALKSDGPAQDDTSNGAHAGKANAVSNSKR